MTRHRQLLGAAGEARAADWYVEQGYTVLDRNWRRREGEIDLVLARAGHLVFCEVKTRSGDGYGSPFDAVTQGKRRKLRRLGLLWLAQPHVRGFPRMRFDVVGVLWRPGEELTVDHRVEAF